MVETPLEQSKIQLVKESHWVVSLVQGSQDLLAKELHAFLACAATRQSGNPMLVVVQQEVTNLSSGSSTSASLRRSLWVSAVNRRIRVCRILFSA